MCAFVCVCVSIHRTWTNANAPKCVCLLHTNLRSVYLFCAFVCGWKTTFQSRNNIIITMTAINRMRMPNVS